MRSKMSRPGYLIGTSLTAAAIVAVLAFNCWIVPHMWESGAPFVFPLMIGGLSAVMVVILISLFPTLRREHYEGY
jgi:hypothetical protein